MITETYTIQTAPSSALEGFTNAVITAGSFDDCQLAISTLMETATEGSFTLPVRAADGSWVALGRYMQHGDSYAEGEIQRQTG